MVVIPGCLGQIDPAMSNPTTANPVKLVNLTPHPLAIHAGGKVLDIPVGGTSPRLATSRTDCAPINAFPGITVPVSMPTMGAIQGLPDPQPGTVFIVSALVAAEAKRPDVLSPGEAIRDADGRIIGANGLSAYA